MTTTNPLLVPTLSDLRARTSMKWGLYPSDVLPLWVAEMDVSLAPAVTEAIVRAAQTGDTGYPYGTAYAESVASFAADRWGWDGLDPSRTAQVPDVMMGIVEVLRLLTRPGDAVVVTAPVYAPFFAFVTHADRQVVETSLSAEHRLDPAAIEDGLLRARAGGSKNPVVLLSNPHNPTGTVHTRAELESIAQVARRHGARIVSDEIHAPLVYSDAAFVPMLSVVGAENAFALTSGSKAFNLAGLKAALLMAGPEAVDDLGRLPEEVSHGPSHVGILAHTAGFARGGDWLDALLAGLEDNRTLLGRLLEEHLPQVSWTPPQATYLAWLDASALGLSAAASADALAVVSDLAGPAEFFLEEARVALSSGHVFGRGGEDAVRLNFATRPEILTDAVTRMGRAVSAVR
ncbi:MalY/PatB family protein [Brevibacterium yomogidense]|uniref:MalY/PatB family protein n=1 Tax=Brevibacterium yomogidense TaxID=946573 RepID=UPI0018E03C1F|nr:aminotransferase class I/II-fold pyridoxal phosphate-dependent enzyme [Brevibacterium yomogidense]